MSALVGTESLVDGKQVIVVHADDYVPAKRIFKDFAVVGCNGEDTDMSAIMGKPVVLIGQAASIHAGILHATGSTVKVIDDELDPYIEHIHALAWAKDRAYLYEPTASAQDSEAPAVIPFSAPSDTATDATLPEMPAYLAESLPVEALGYPDPSAFTDHSDISVQDEWPEPSNMFNDGMPEEFAPGMLPSFAEDMIFDVATRQGTDPGMGANSWLTVVSACCDDNFKLQMGIHDDSWRVSPRLWAANVADSARGKSPAMSAYTGELSASDMERKLEVIRNKKNYEQRMKVYAAQEKAWIEKAKHDSALVFDVAEPELEPDRCVVVNNFTLAYMWEFLRSHRKAFVVGDELGSVIGGFDRFQNGSSERMEFLQLYEGGTYVTGRIGRGEFAVKNASICLLGNITPSVIREQSKGGLQADGLLQRMMLVCAREKRDRIDQAPNKKAAAAFSKIVHALIETDAPANTSFKLSSGAFECLQEFVRDLEKMQAFGGYSEPHKSHLGKLEGMAGRIMVTLHLAQSIERGNHYPDPIINTILCEQVCNLLRHWLIPNIDHFWLNVLGQGKTGMPVQKIVLWIIGKGGEYMRNADIQNVLGKEWDEMDIPGRNKIITALNEHGFISSLQEGRRTAGVLPTRHKINPRVFEKFRYMVEPERIRRESIKSFLDEKKAAAAARRQK